MYATEPNRQMIQEDLPIGCETQLMFPMISVNSKTNKRKQKLDTNKKKQITTENIPIDQILREVESFHFQLCLIYVYLHIASQI
jgi:hypothetical protein